MSLILDALRKSEEHRRLGETPTLINESVWASRRKRSYGDESRRGWWLALPAVAAIVAGAWWLGTRSGASSTDATAVVPAATAPASAQPEAIPPTSTAITSTPSPAPASAAPARKPDTVTQAPPSTVPAPLAALPQSPDDAERGSVALDPETRRRFEQGEVFVNSPDQLQTVKPTTEVAYVPPEAALPQPLPEPDDVSARLIAAAPPPAPVPTETPHLFSLPAPQPTVAPAPTPNAAPVVSTPAPVATPAPVYGEALITIYDLPLSTRKALPALKMSMHVYTADPTGRFVLLDGKHVAEGQPLDNDLNVREIRADGVVLDYRGQRFLLPRAGR